MKLKWFGVVFAAIIFLLYPLQSVFAACESFHLVNASGTTISTSSVDSEKSFTITFDLADSKPSDYSTSGWFKMYLSPGPTSDRITPSGGKISYAIPAGALDVGKTYSVNLKYDAPDESDRSICTKTFTTASTSSSCSISVTPAAPSSTDAITATVTLTTTETGYNLYYDPTGGRVRDKVRDDVKNGDKVALTNYGIGNATLFIAKGAVLSKRLCEKSFTVTEKGGNALETQFTDLCTYAKDEAKEDCLRCISDDSPGIWTAIGCVPASLSGFIGKILPFLMGLAGGIAFVLMLFGSLQMMMSAGNPEKLNAGKELLTSAIIGLLLVIFSVFILRTIGVTILGIPGFR